MKAIHIRNVREPLLLALKRLAAAHHRSLQGELHSILEEAARRAPVAEAVAKLDLITVKSTGSTTWGREEIYSDDAR